MSVESLAAGAATTRASGQDARVALPRTLRLCAPAAVVALAGVLRLVNLSAVKPNPYYDSAVRTMSQSWHAFFVGAFAPGSGLAIDKPPVDLWLQVASTKLLGWSTVTLLLPEAIAGTIAVALLYDLLRTLFGWAAGVAGALALAVLPIAVITSRSDTMDSVMCALVVGAAALVARGARPGGRRSLFLWAGALYGIAFNVKLLESLVALPALLLLGWLASDETPRVRVRRLAAMLAVFVAISLSWLTAVSLLPAHDRPWYIGSTNGSPWNATFVFNGIDRIAGPPPHPAPPAADNLRPTRSQVAARAVSHRQYVIAHRAALRRRPTAPGPTRLLSSNASLDKRIGTELVAAWLALALALALGAWRRLDRVGRAGFMFLGGWLATGTLLFSAMHRLSPRYLEAFTPAVAGSLGAGIVLAAGAAGARWAGRRGWSVAAAAVLALVLVAPTVTSIQAVARGSVTSGRLGDRPPARLAALSAFLRAHQGTARYEIASLSAAKAGPLVVHDGRPVMILTSLYGQPFVSVKKLAATVAAGDVHYAYMGANCTPASGDRLTGCSAQAQWIRRHGIDVSRAAGQPPHSGLVYRLSAAPVRVGAHVHGRTPRSARSSSTSSSTA